MKKLIIVLLLLVCAGITAREVGAQTNPAAQAVPYSQDFSGLAHSSTAYPAGWQGWTISVVPGAVFNTGGPTADRALTASSTAAINSGNVHNYNGKMGYLNSGSLDLTLVLAINTTGLTSVGVTYDIMTIRNPYDGTANTRINEVTLQYRVGTSGTWTSLTGIEYQNNTTLQTGAVTTPQNSQTKNIVLPAAADNQAVVQLRWASRQVSGGGARPSFAFDNLVVATGSVSDVAPSVSSTTPPNGSSGIPLGYDISITFSEPVTAPAAAFSISCANSGAHTFALSGGPTVFNLNPDVNFSANELCTVTVDDLQVADVDANDPPDNMTADYVFSFTSVDPASCGTAFTAIFTIQGSGTASPIVGTSVTTEGVVVGDFQGSTSLSGFYIQDPSGDANTATSDGIFVFDGASPVIDVSPGDRVRITGTVTETFNNTGITPTSVIVCSTGNPLPAATTVDLPEPVNNDLERYENMLVVFPETLTITGNFQLGRFGELVLSSDGRLFQQNNFNRTNSPGALNVAATNPLRYVVLDDGRSIQNPDPTPYVDASNTRRVGDTVAGLTGVLTFDFSEYRVQPTIAPVFTAANPRTAAPAAVGGTVKVSSFNVLNYFNGDGLGSGFPTSRGATSLAEFNRQRDKIIAAMVAINADVFGVIEIENDGNGANSAIQDLVNGLNTATAAGTFAFAEGVTPGTDQIKNSIIYKPGTVTPVGAAFNDTDAIWTGQARNPLAQTFSLNTNGAMLVYIVNHFTSKACSASDTGQDADQGDGEGCDSLQRTLQAQALLDFVEERQNTTGEARVLVQGDLNAYGEEDPIFELEDDTADRLADGPGGLIDLAQKFLPTTNRYSYQFDEQSGYLDHALASKELEKYISGTTIWHINADEPTVLDYNVEFKSTGQQAINVGTPYRSSDHDPIVVGINLLLPTAADGNIVGRITDAHGGAIPGVVVKLAGTQNRKTITDANGNYRFENVETSGFYTVTPTRANYSFGPIDRSFSQLGNQTEAGFTGSPLSEIRNPLDTSEYFVRQHYLDFLGREPDEAGFNFWSDQILECGGDASCIETKRINVSAAYFLSVEFQRTGGLVDGLYRASFGRAPKYTEFMPDTAVLAQNIVVGRGDWEGQLTANKRAFIDAFVNRSSFRAAYDGLNNAGYVHALVNNTGVNFDASEREGFVGMLNRGATRGEVLLQIAEHEGFVAAKRNAAFVMMEYFGYLRRDPDQAGYDFWLRKLNQFGGNFERAEMVKAFISSGEYRDRFPK